jgi:hypothetical protein
MASLVDDPLERKQLGPALDRTVLTNKGYYLVHRQAGAKAKVVKLFRAWLQSELQAPGERVDPGRDDEVQAPHGCNGPERDATPVSAKRPPSTHASCA